MKKSVFFIAILSILLLGVHVCAAGDWGAYYPNVYGYSGDDSRVIDRFSWDGHAHLVITWSNAASAASAVEMDPDSRPLMYYGPCIYQ